MNSCRLAVFVFVSKFKTRTLHALKLLAWAIWMLFSLSLNFLKPRWFFQNPLTSTARIPTDLALLLFLFFSGVYLQFSRSIVFDSLRHHESQHARPPWPSPTPRVYPNSCPLSQWCHLAISSSVVPFSCLQFFPASGSFPMSQFFTSGNQSIGVSALASFPSKEHPGLISFRMDWLDLLVVQEFSPTPQFKSINSLALSFLHSPTLISIHDYWKNHSLD